MDSLTEEVEAGLVKSVEIADSVVPAMSKLIEKISPAIATLSDKLGTTAEHLWTILVAQSYNYAIGNAVIILITGICLYVTIRGCSVWDKKIDDGDLHLDGKSRIMAIRILAPILSIIILTTNILNLTHRVVNPEFYALHEVLKHIN